MIIYLKPAAIRSQGMNGASDSGLKIYQNYFTTNFYQNIDDLYLYNWISGSATAVTNIDAGTIDLNTWYKMTVKAHGNNFDAFVDDIIRINNAS